MGLRNANFLEKNHWKLLQNEFSGIFSWRRPGEILRASVSGKATLFGNSKVFGRFSLTGCVSSTILLSASKFFVWAALADGENVR